MKDQFHVFNVGEMPKLDNKDKELLVVLDTNILLHVLRYSRNSRQKLFQSIKKVDSRIFIPYIVGLEYNTNKKNVMHSLTSAENSFKKKYESIRTKTIGDFNTEFNKLGSKITSSDEAEVRKRIKENFSETVNEVFDKFFEERVKEELSLITVDTQSINEFEKLYEGKVAQKPTQSWINEIETRGEERYANNIPPGYLDKNKTDISIFYGTHYKKKYGDLILWEEIIKKAKDEHIKKVVFISDDLKEDWIFKIEEEEIGVRAELREELWREAEADLFLLTSNKFLSLSGVGEEITKIDNIDWNRNESDTSVIDKYLANMDNRVSREDLYLSELNDLSATKINEFLYRLRSTINKVRSLNDKVKFNNNFYTIQELKTIMENLDILRSSNIIKYGCSLELVNELDFISENIEVILDNRNDKDRNVIILEKLLSVLHMIDYKVSIKAEEIFN
ncbi:PIN domain-containing protein [Enterococcus casseliflavus]|uniref:PIN domain-containing protein n=1 Tax=Enterococcus casseliflavus TaxID=37734 RepID=UPI003D0C4613